MSFGGDAANAFVMHGENEPEDTTRIDATKDLWIWLPSNLSFSVHHEKSAQKTFAILRMIRRTFSRITRIDFQTIYGAYVRPLLEYANQVVYSGHTKDITLIELHHEKSAQKTFAILRMIRRTFSRITRIDFQTIYGAYVRPLLEYANQVVYSGHTKDITLIERV
ncbi:hypothetical protein CLF_105274 [Clonorchis sinensis]|uniref:Uncharacterized protein n=1 Tax=Clonorchis sinensis TaxID=79923 RepID=G7YP62_CLOSI|nr:hypothetical protein CLF_105274 [Clonorchis sinensis]